VVERAAAGQVAKCAHSFCRTSGGGGRLTKYATGAVTAANSQFHAPARNQVQGGKETGGDGNVAHCRISDAGAQPQRAAVGGHQSEQRIRFLPQNMRVKDPTVLKSRFLRLASKAG